MSEADIVALFDAGLYKDAAAAIDSLSAPSRSLKILRARLESHVGPGQGARAMAESLVRDSLTPVERAQCYDIIARVAASHGQTEAGLKAIGAALTAARQSQSPALEGRILLSNAELLLNWIAIEPAAVEIPKLRRVCLAAGDSFLSIGFHRLIAEIQAKKGLAAAARASLKTARTLLKSWPNVYQQGLLAVTSSAIEFFQADYDVAMECTAEALACSERSGARDVRVPALGNLAHIRLAQGKFDEARAAIHEFQKTVRKGGSAEIAGLDTEMEIALAAGQLEMATNLAAKAAIASSNLDNGNSYHGLWNTLSQVRLLYRTGQPAAGLTMAMEIIPRIKRIADRHLLERMQLLAAEGFARTGQETDGSALLARVMRAIADPPLEIVAEAARVAGCLTATSDPIAAQAHFERSARIFNAIGNLTAVANVQSDVAQFIRQANGGAISVNNGETIGPPKTSHSAAALSDRFVDLLDLGGHTRLLGAEALSLIRDSRVASSARLTETSLDGERNTIAGDVVPREKNTTPDENTICVPLGEHRDRKYAIEVEAYPTASARASVLSVERIVDAALTIADARRTTRGQAALWSDSTPGQELGLICTSDRMADLIKTIRRVASSNLTILFTGETGVGKELFARALHLTSPRKERTFLPFNCTTVPKDMFDSQLFGHRRGAFTGAHEAGTGVIRGAAGGTLFLDEIGEMALEVQPKLLRFLESGEIHPLGESKPQQVDVRIVAATNKNLEQLVSEGRFREDLYYRLNVLTIQIPPLRERREEIPPLVEHFLERHSRELQKPMPRVADETLEYLLLYRWPGNIRQLANELRRIVALMEPGEVVTPSHLSQDIIASRRTVPVQQSEVVIDLAQPLQDATDQLERAAIERALKAADGNNDVAAKSLGLSRKGLYLKRQRLRLK